MSPLADTLHLISQGIHDIEAAYEAESVDFPSLDDPWAPSALDAKTQAATALVTAAAFQLISMVRAPHDSVMETSLAMYLSAALGVVERANVSEILSGAGPKGMHIQEIGKIAGIPSDKLGRFLRLLASRNIFREVEPDVFARNRLSSVLDTGKTVEDIKADPIKKHDGTHGFPAMVGHSNDECLRACGYMVDHVFSEKAYSQDPMSNPFTTAHKIDTPIWEWFAAPGNELRHNRFGAAMRGTTALMSPEAILDGPAWGSLTSGDVIVDVGGGIGSTTLVLAKKYPQFQYIVQDRPETIADGVKLFQSSLPSALSSGVVRLEAHDFFTKQPITNAAIYLLRFIVHDWPTEYAQKILRLLRDAAQPSTKLILAEQIAPYVCSSEDTFSHIEGSKVEAAPPPLLSNMGIAGSLVYYADMQMMNNVNSQERTLGEFVELGKATGWKLERIYRHASRGGAQLIYAPS